MLSRRYSDAALMTLSRCCDGVHVDRADAVMRSCGCACELAFEQNLKEGMLVVIGCRPSRPNGDPFKDSCQDVQSR